VPRPSSPRRPRGRPRGRDRRAAELRPLLLNYLDLARFQNAPQAEALSPVELERLCSAAPAQARALLETQGYFNANVVLSRTPAPAGQAERVVVKVEPGVPTRGPRQL
jgi:translocation and assembly module TamA